MIDAALPVTATFVTQEELAQLPLRKPPKVTEEIRMVQVAGFDWSACGGTHVANSAQVGLVKITGVERRGGELRVTFLCGGRARADYARLQALASGLAIPLHLRAGRSSRRCRASHCRKQKSCARTWPISRRSGSRRRQRLGGARLHRKASSA